MKRFGFTLLLFFFCVTFSTAHPSWGIAVDKHRNVYFADISHNGQGSVWELTKNGKLKLILGNFHAHNVNIDADGNVYTAHGEDHHTMLKINPSGNTDTLYHCTNYKEFFGGNCAYTPNGEIVFATDHKLIRISKSGEKAQLNNVPIGWCQSAYADDEGNYYLPDLELEGGGVFKIDPKGNREILATNLITKLDRPRDKHNDVLLGITKGCDGYMYIAENAGHRIIKILGNGKSETFYKSEGDWFPTGIDFFSGDAYVMEYRNTPKGIEGPQIVKIDESGKKTLLFNYEDYHKMKKGEAETNFVAPLLSAMLFVLGIYAISTTTRTRLT